MGVFLILTVYALFAQDQQEAKRQSRVAGSRHDRWNTRVQICAEHRDDHRLWALFLGAHTSMHLQDRLCLPSLLLVRYHRFGVFAAGDLVRSTAFQQRHLGGGALYSPHEGHPPGGALFQSHPLESLHPHGRWASPNSLQLQCIIGIDLAHAIFASCFYLQYASSIDISLGGACVCDAASHLQGYVASQEARKS